MSPPLHGCHKAQWHDAGHPQDSMFKIESQCILEIMSRGMFSQEFFDSFLGMIEIVSLKIHTILQMPLEPLTIQPEVVFAINSMESIMAFLTSIMQQFMSLTLPPMPPENTRTIPFPNLHGNLRPGRDVIYVFINNPVNFWQVLGETPICFRMLQQYNPLCLEQK